MSRVILPAVLTATFVFLLAPIVVVVVASFNGVGVLSFPPRAFTTRWYYEIDPSFYRALWVSLVVGVITVVSVRIMNGSNAWTRPMTTPVKLLMSGTG